MRGKILAFGGAIALLGGAAAAQTVDVERPRTLVVGTPAGGARADRVDGARTGRSPDALPTGSLRIVWHLPAGSPIEVAPVVDGSGVAYAVGSRGEVVAFGRDGAESWRVATGANQPGPPALLSDGTLVFADRLGEAVAVRDGAVRWRTSFGRTDTARLAPLALGDGGVVVATTHDVAALDVEGAERARTTFPDGLAGPLLGALGQVVAVGLTGAVWTWTPGAVEPTRVGSFGEAPSSGAALLDSHTLVAITSGGAHLASLDLVRGTSSTLLSAPSGLWIGAPAVRSGVAYAQVLATTGELILAVDGSGAEVARAPLEAHPAPVGLDGGAAQVGWVAAAPPIVDAAGDVAFATVEGSVGVASASAVNLVPSVCPTAMRPRPEEPAVTALVPMGPGLLLVACRTGSLVAFAGTSGDAAAAHL